MTSPIFLTVRHIPAESLGIRGLLLSENEVRWVGATDPPLQAPWLDWRLNRQSAAGELFWRAVSTGHSRAIADLVPALPLPSGPLDALARHCVAQDRDSSLQIATGVVERRWGKALARALLAAGIPETSPGRTLTVTEPGMLQLAAE
ncbi:MAG: hypothetical protein H7338_17180 [Candidatus Sericytochromatia bacterium]|nr:hypothetical protein [Candidatus Sericytochromatia bacterium]